MSGLILEARALSKVYRRGASEVRAVDGIDLDVEAGEFMAIMGRSGSGKTTLLDLLGCLLRPTDGQLSIDGRSVIGASDGELATIRRERIGFVFQEFNLIPTLTAIENVLLPLRYGPRRPDAKARAGELLELVGLSQRAGHRPTELSGGEQQRVAIARALVNEPAVILADEPTGELDSATSDRLMTTLRQLNEIPRHRIRYIQPFERFNCRKRRITGHAQCGAPVRPRSQALQPRKAYAFRRSSNGDSLAAAQDRGRQTSHAIRNEQQQCISLGFFQRLQQAVGSVACQHVSRLDHDNLGAAFVTGQGQFADQFADLVEVVADLNRE